MNSLISLGLYKISSIFNSKTSFSATVFGCKIDKNAAIRQNCRIYNSSLGRYTYICRNSLIQNTQIGSFCSISENCNIGMPSHPVDRASTSPVFLEGKNYLRKNFTSFPYENTKKTVIGNDVWIGAGVQIKSGVKIGNGAIIGAGAVVTKDIPDYAVVGGVPAKIIKYRFDEEKQARLLKSEWWNWDEAEIEKNTDFFR